MAGYPVKYYFCRMGEKKNHWLFWVILLCLWWFAANCRFVGHQSEDTTSHKNFEVKARSGESNPDSTNPLLSAGGAPIQEKGQIPSIAGISENEIPLTQIHFLKGIALFEAGKYQEGIKEFDTVLQLDSSLVNAWINRGKAYMEIKNYSRAVTDLQKATQLQPDDTTAYIYLGLTHFHLGNLKECIEANTRWIELSPRSAMAYYNRGIAYGNLKDYKRAIEDFQRALKIDPNFSKAYFNLGLSYYWSGDTINACLNWQNAARLGLSVADEVVKTYCQ